MNVIARLEYELAYYDSAVHRFNHYTTRTPRSVRGVYQNYRNLSYSHKRPLLTSSFLSAILLTLCQTKFIKWLRLLRNYYKDSLTNKFLVCPILTRTAYCDAMLVTVLNMVLCLSWYRMWRVQYDGIISNINKCFPFSNTMCLSRARYEGVLLFRLHPVFLAVIEAPERERERERVRFYEKRHICRFTESLTHCRCPEGLPESQICLNSNSTDNRLPTSQHLNWLLFKIH